MTVLSKKYFFNVFEIIKMLNGTILLVLHSLRCHVFFTIKRNKKKTTRWWLPSLFENICQHDFSLIVEGFRCNNRWRSERDLNSRTVLPVYELSKPTSSASWVSLQSFSVVKRQHYYFIEFGHDVKKKLIETRKHGDKNGIILAWNTKLIEITAIRESINS